MSQVNDSNPLELIMPRLEGFLLRNPSPEVLAGARDRFDVVYQSITEISSTFAEIHGNKTSAEIKLSYIAAKRDVILANEVELSEDATKVHDKNTAENNTVSNVIPIDKYHPPVKMEEEDESVPLDDPTIIDDPNQQKMAEEARAILAQAPDRKVVEEQRLKVQNPDADLPLAA